MDLISRTDLQNKLIELEEDLKARAGKDSLGRAKRWSEAEFRYIDAVMRCRQIVDLMPSKGRE